MASISIWLIAIVLESAPLVRAVRGGFTKSYKLFYLYLCFMLVRDLCLYAIYFLAPKAYPWSYWTTELAGVLLGCGLVWETYKIALAAYEGAARMARKTLPLLFIFAFARILVQASMSPNWIPGRTPLETEIDLQALQLVLLLGLIALLAYYSIPLGRNLKGILYGYGLFLATNLSGLMLRQSLGDSFHNSWHYIEPASYLCVLAVWCWALWSYAPAPEPEREPSLEADYEALVAATRGKLRVLRARVWRGIQP
jgi:hypothetical protein